ncbi:hypothetical protein KY343_03020 [Candidatus Woesearchaeota archaeon]|nr:hypothetical protein [Candidatus Woesearchaeota archaeon]
MSLEEKTEKGITMRRRGAGFKLKTAFALLALAAQGCVSYISAGLGALVPGRSNEGDVPTSLTVQGSYGARKGPWEVGGEVIYGNAKDSDPGDVPGNEPAYDSQMGTTIGSVYVARHFREGKKVRSYLSAGLGFLYQNIDTDVGAPVNDSFNEWDSAFNAFVAGGLKFGNPDSRVSPYVEAKQIFNDSDNIPNSTVLSAGAKLSFP